MTNQDAITLLQLWKAYMDSLDADEDERLTIEAIAVAIEALQERKPGKWIKGGHCCGETEWICPECNASEWRTNRVPFCPWCGNPMEVDK